MTSLAAAAASAEASITDGTVTSFRLEILDALSGSAFMDAWLSIDERYLRARPEQATDGELEFVADLDSGTRWLLDHRHHLVHEIEQAPFDAELASASDRSELPSSLSLFDHGIPEAALCAGLRIGTTRPLLKRSGAAAIGVSCMDAGDHFMAYEVFNLELELVDLRVTSTGLIFRWTAIENTRSTTHQVRDWDGYSSASAREILSGGLTLAEFERDPELAQAARDSSVPASLDVRGEKP